MRLYDSLSRKVQEVVPVEDNLVKMYSCGPTVYRYIHIGNMRSFMLGDVLRRALRFEGFQVRWIMNVTDVGHMTDEVTDTGRDKMELAEADEGRTGPGHEVAEPVGRGLPRLAHRVFGDVDEAPRGAIRHPHWRQRQQVPPSRGRDRAVGGRDRPSRRLDLGARRVPPDGRTE